MGSDFRFLGRFSNWFLFASLLSSDRGCLQAAGWQAWLNVKVDSGILSVMSCTVKDKCIMGLCERIANVVISSCKIPFLLTDFPVLPFCLSLVSV